MAAMVTRRHQGQRLVAHLDRAVVGLVLVHLDDDAPARVVGHRGVGAEHLHGAALGRRDGEGHGGAGAAPRSRNWRTISTFGDVEVALRAARDRSGRPGARGRPRRRRRRGRSWPISPGHVPQRAQAGHHEHHALRRRPRRARTGSARTMTGSWSDVEITGWLTIGLPCSPRRKPSCSSCSMAGSWSCTPERAPRPAVVHDAHGVRSGWCRPT